MLLALALGVVLSGCGYRLRDDATLTALLIAPRIIDQTGDRELLRALRRRLRDRGAQVDPPADAASGEIRVLRSALTRESLSIGIAGQAGEVRLTYTLRCGCAGGCASSTRSGDDGAGPIHSRTCTGTMGSSV